MMRQRLSYIYIMCAGMAMLSASPAAMGQTASPIPDGYYTLTPFLQEAGGYVYSYDTDALRNPYGNVADYANPLGRNGEYAYLYAVPSTGVSLAGSALYFSRGEDGTYTIQSCSGEAYSYLDVALYDRHLLKFSCQPRRSFNLHSQWDDMEALPASEHIMQQVQNAALCDSLATTSHGLGSLQVLLPVDEAKITPALTIRRPLSDAKGILALYRSGDNPGEVPALLSSHLQELIDEAQALVASKATTAEQAEDIILRLKEATAAYAETAPSHLNPMSDGYYFLTSAYRAFELRQSKQKVIVTENTADGNAILRWNTGNVNDGSMAFRIRPEGDTFVMQDYRGRYVSHPSAEDRTLSLQDNSDGATQEFRYDTEGLWVIADASLPGALLTAANSFVGEKGLYGKPTDGDIRADGSMYLYPGYCSSWRIEKAYHTLTVTTTGWAALSVSFPVEVPADMEVFTVWDEGGELYLKPWLENVIPARTAVVVHAAKGNYTFWSTTDCSAEAKDNALVANCENRTGIESGSMATLKVKNGVVGFAKTTAKTLAAGAAYVPYSADLPDFRELKDYEDGIGSLTSDPSPEEGNIYDLAGRKVKTAGKGLYIINNKKILK